MPEVKVTLARKVLESNDAVAARVRGALAEKGVFMLNVMGSPGGGKTELIRALARTSPELASSTLVVEGDVAGTIDAEKMAEAGLEVVQVNTGGACHLSAVMVEDAFAAAGLEGRDLVLVENVGNLVCPASFDLGEDARLVVTSVTEGWDKPTKYPGMYAKADAVAVSKCDMAGAVGVDPEEIARRALEVNPSLEVFYTSARSGEGVAALAEWLFVRREEKKGGAS